MRADYDVKANVLSLTTEVPAKTSASLLDDPGVVVALAESEGHDIVGLIVMGAAAYLPLQRGYDPETDTLLLGEKTNSPELITENGDFIGYWQVYEDEPKGFMDPVGVLIRDASKHLAPVIANLPG